MNPVRKIMFTQLPFSLRLISTLITLMHSNANSSWNPTAAVLEMPGWREKVDKSFPSAFLFNNYSSLSYFVSLRCSVEFASSISASKSLKLFIT